MSTTFARPRAQLALVLAVTALLLPDANAAELRGLTPNVLCDALTQPSEREACLMRLSPPPRQPATPPGAAPSAAVAVPPGPVAAGWKPRPDPNDNDDLGAGFREMDAALAPARNWPRPARVSAAAEALLKEELRTGTLAAAAVRAATVPVLSVPDSYQVPTVETALSWVPDVQAPQAATRAGRCVARLGGRPEGRAADARRRPRIALYKQLIDQVSSDERLVEPAKACWHWKGQLVQLHMVRWHTSNPVASLSRTWLPWGTFALLADTDRISPPDAGRVFYYNRDRLAQWVSSTDQFARKARAESGRYSQALQSLLDTCKEQDRREYCLYAELHEGDDRYLGAREAAQKCRAGGY